ncbi:hypothetical protein M0208_01085 [Sphingomonas sp. SUN019]|uniref:hypothetical protein n=1 Tax=Sphingomonas sp. SUN019 TaxID=2937788 RepID=UPI002164EA8F|nr:hypothetical protein [Sphingomonas sp. SUN019]UVO49178.1 hypothetical protein M0208_01085 [Sphingomonas sp. SUN019]
MRISSLAALILLAACGKAETDTQVLAQAEANQSAAATDDGALNCAVAGATEFSRTCTLDREETARGLLLTARHHDGGFRRLLVTTDGRGVIAADGAEPAKVTIVDNGEIEVAVGDDHYRLPATVREGAAPAP